MGYKQSPMYGDQNKKLGVVESRTILNSTT